MKNRICLWAVFVLKDSACRQFLHLNILPVGSLNISRFCLRSEVHNLVVVDYLQADILVLDSAAVRIYSYHNYLLRRSACRQVSTLVRQLAFREQNTLHNCTFPASIFMNYLAIFRLKFQQAGIDENIR